MGGGGVDHLLGGYLGVSKAGEVTVQPLVP